MRQCQSHQVWRSYLYRRRSRKLSSSKTFEKAPLKTAMPDESHTSVIKEEDHIGYWEWTTRDNHKNRIMKLAKADSTTSSKRIEKRIETQQENLFGCIMYKTSTSSTGKETLQAYVQESHEYRHREYTRPISMKTFCHRPSRSCIRLDMITHVEF